MYSITIYKFFHSFYFIVIKKDKFIKSKDISSNMKKGYESIDDLYPNMTKERDTLLDMIGLTLPGNKTEDVAIAKSYLQGWYANVTQVKIIDNNVVIESNAFNYKKKNYFVPMETFNYSGDLSDQVLYKRDKVEYDEKLVAPFLAGKKLSKGGKFSGIKNLVI